MSRRTTTSEAQPGALNHRRMLGRARALTRRLKRLAATQFGGGEPAPDLDSLVISLVALACLARRALCPGWLADTPAISLYRALTKEAALTTDSTEFGRYLTSILVPAAELSDNPAFIEPASSILGSADALALSGDPLLAGWVHQCLGERSRRTLAGISADANAQSARSHDIAASSLPALTQWYTPAWIADFLVEQTIGKHYAEKQAGKLSLFDPACGAGHLLNLALARLVIAEREHSRRAVDQIVGDLLQDQLFGCDIDSHATGLAAFALYLSCRDFVPSGELPLPNLFHFNINRATSIEQAALGSLWLGLDAVPSNLFVWSLDSVIPLRKSQLNRQFDVILANPPYLSHRLMPPQVSSFVKDHYQLGHFDLYGAFLLLAMRLLTPGGRLGMICQQSFMSIQRYADLRTELTEQCALESIVQLGAGVFAARAGEKVNNAVLVARRRPLSAPADGSGASPAPACASPQYECDPEIRCWRVLEPAEKVLAEERGIASLPETRVPHAQFAIISGAPFAFWCPPSIARLFHAHPPMESSDTRITLTNGLFTCNNSKFVKPHWQVPEAERDEYVPYDKGGGQKWYRTTPYLLHWGKDGAAIREYRAKRGQSRKLPGERFYFQTGVTYSYIGTKGFRARLLSPNAIFDIASSAVFSEVLDPLYLLGFLNSSFIRFLLGVLNPTINFQIGDLRRLPLAMPDGSAQKAVAAKAATAVDLAQTIDAFDHTSPRFREPVLFTFNGAGNHNSAYQRYREYIEGLNRIEADCQRAIDDLIYDLYDVAGKERAAIESDPWVAREHKPLSKPMTFNQCWGQVEDCGLKGCG